MNDKHEIEIPGLPEGWKAVAYRRPMKDIDYVLTQYGVRLYIHYTFDHMLIVKKIKPRRIVLEETEEVRSAQIGEFYALSDGRLIQHGGSSRPTADSYTIWRVMEFSE